MTQWMRLNYALNETLNLYAGLRGIALYITHGNLASPSKITLHGMSLQERGNPETFIQTSQV